GPLLRSPPSEVLHATNQSHARDSHAELDRRLGQPPTRGARPYPDGLRGRAPYAPKIPEPAAGQPRGYLSHLQDSPPLASDSPPRPASFVAPDSPARPSIAFPPPPELSLHPLTHELPTRPPPALVVAVSRRYAPPPGVLLDAHVCCPGRMTDCTRDSDP